MFRHPPRRLRLRVLLMWASLALACAIALVDRRWPLAFVAVLTFLLTLAPMVLIRRAGIRLPASFTIGIVFFIYATIFLGEALSFYHRYWWWDILLHGGSALGFGMVGFLFAFVMFEDAKYSAPAWALGFIGFAIAVTIGALWEIFEFTMDFTFGTNMQKSGLPDTMGDLVVDVIGGSIGGLAGFLWLKGRHVGGLAGIIGQFVMINGWLPRRRR
jgi:hypothetical protein